MAQSQNEQATEFKKVTVASGDGVGPEITDLVLDVLQAVKAPLELERVSLAPTETGELSLEAQDSLERTGLLLNGPMEAQDRSTVDSLLRSQGQVFAHKQIHRTLPGVPTPLGLKPLNLTLVRELASEEIVEEDLGGDVVQLRRTSTRTDALRLCAYAFEIAARKRARRVTFAHRLDQRRLSHGIFQGAFHEIAARYPHLEADEIPLNELAQRLLVEPEAYDVILLPEMEGDLIHELATGLVGGTAYAPSARIGERLGIFETTHGPRFEEAGRDVANPTAMILASTILLRYVELTEHAVRIEEALGRTLTRMQSDSMVKQFSNGFSLSIFRHLLLAELRGDGEKTASSRSLSIASEDRFRNSSNPFDDQLNGLA